MVNTLMKKVLYIPGGRPTGGVGTFMYNYQKNFNEDKIKVDYLFFTNNKDGIFDEKVKKLGSNVYILQELKYSNIRVIYRELNKFFCEHKGEYDIVHVHSPNIAILCLPIAKKYGIKNLIVHSHATMYSDKVINSIRNRILCIPIKKIANIYFSCSKDAGKFLYGKHYMENGKVTVINNAIDCMSFKYNNQVRDEVREVLSIQNKLVIGHVGRFCEQKNHKFLIEIFNEIKKKNTDSILLLVGDGPLIEKIKDQVISMKIEEDVIFLGQRSDINKILQAIDIFILPSLYEGLPLIGIEAQASGLPCFMADTITQEANINDVQYFSLNESANNIANKILNYYSRFIRKDSTNKIKLAGFDIKVEAKKLECFYRNLK